MPLQISTARKALEILRRALSAVLRPKDGAHSIRMYPDNEGWAATCNCRAEEAWYRWEETRENVAVEVHLHLIPHAFRSDQAMWG